jgi:hypothetical protein
MRIYRDKFLAHLDSEKIMRLPQMDTAKGSVFYYYGYLLRNETDQMTCQDGPSDLAGYYQMCVARGSGILR